MPTYEFPRPAVTVDVVALSVIDDTLSVLLMKRDAPPFAGQLALPGAFVHEGEALEESAVRVLAAKTPLPHTAMTQLSAFSAIDRDPRDWTITVAFLAIIPTATSTTHIEHFYPLADVAELAFDHGEILKSAVISLQANFTQTRYPYAFLPKTFTLTDLQKICEAVTGQPIDKRNFRKTILGLGTVTPTGEKTSGGKHRPAALYKTT